MMTWGALYRAWKTNVDARLESHGISSGDVNAFGFGRSLIMRFTLLTGGFDLDDIRTKLEGRHYDKSEYKSVELWELQGGAGYEADNSVALMGGLVISGNESGVESCIKVIKEGDSSWLKKADIRDEVNSLPVGVYVGLEKSDLAGLWLAGFEAYGVSADEQDRDTLEIAGAAKFEDENNADNAENAIATVLDTVFDNVDVSHQAAIVTASAELDIDRAESLFDPF